MADVPDAATAARLRALASGVDEALAAMTLPAEPEALYAPVRYVLAGGGKRVRAQLVLLAAEAFGGPSARERALPAALAVEVFHAFTLVHDDIMDGAATRRGRPAVHVRWNEATAILAGDLLMGLAYRLLDAPDLGALGPPADARRANSRAAFHAMVARLCEGQALDLAFETTHDVAVDDYLDMIDGKTGALLGCALTLGALAGGADEAALAALVVAGRDLGRAFQIQDDLLDLTAPPETWGKPLGGDLVEGKKTFLLLLALARTHGDDRTWFARVGTGGLPPSDVDEARRRLDRLGVLADTSAAVDAYVHSGLAALDVLPACDAATALRSLAASLAHRTA